MKNISLKEDYSFCYVFDNVENISILLNILKGEKIEVLNVTSQCSNKSNIDMKKVIFDIVVETSDKIYIIEMQNSLNIDFKNRLKYYLSNATNYLLRKGKGYGDLKDIEVIVILSKDLLNKNEFIYSYKLRESIDIIDGLELNVYNTNEYNQSSYKVRELFKLINGYDTNLEELQIIKEYMKKIMKKESFIKMNEYFSSYNTRLRAAKLDGIEEGIEKGIEKGMEKGIEKGIEKTSYLLLSFKFNKDENISKLKEMYNVDSKIITRIVNKVYSI